MPKSPAEKRRHADYMRSYYRDLDPERKQAWKDKNKATHLKTRYGITVDQRDEMLARQDFRCASCGDPLGENFNIDHNHACCSGQKSCGKCVRGLLCRNCNWGLGQFKDSVDRLRMAIAYLERF